jgi:nucleoside-diphosphate-sugar epimerase
VFNIGNPANNLTIRELAFVMIDLYRELTGEEPASRVEEIDGEEFYGVGYEDGDRLPPDISRIRALGWEPHFDLRTTFADVMRDYLAQADRLVFTPTLEVASTIQRPRVPLRTPATAVPGYR